MATLGVVLAIAGAKVGAERTELTQALVDQQHAHTQFTGQDIKHRLAVLTLQQLHAYVDPGKANANDLMELARAIERYRAESDAANVWVDAYDPLVEAHVAAQDQYEHGQLAAEIGIVAASIALLLRRRAAWLAALALGAVALGLLVVSYARTRSAVRDASAAIESSETAYEQLRERGKTTDVDRALVDEVRRTFK